VLVNNTGTDLSAFRQLPKTDDVFRVVVAGTLSLRKGSYYLLKAFCELKLPDAELVHLGHVEDNVRPILEPYLKNASVRSLGFKPVEELHRHYSQGSVFVMPSVEEGLAQVQTQAMACGLPLICSTNSGGADLISGDEGFVVPIRDVDAIKDKLSYLYEHRDACEHMGREAKRRVHDHFTWDQYGDRMIAIYHQLLSN
jgi:glycosyltransferase involved in cell wall biosynthesis